MGPVPALGDGSIEGLNVDRPDRTKPTSLGEYSAAVHAGNAADASSGAVRAPIVMSNSYVFPDDPTTLDWAETDQLLYTRASSANQLLLQQKLSALEGGEASVVLGSGVAALHAVFFTYLNSGDHVVVSREVYEATYNLFAELLPRKYGITADLVDATDLAAVEAAFRPETRLVVVESIANPTTSIADVPALAALAHAHDALLVVDSTFTPPPVLRPLEHGADLVVHSLTKYINGHGDALGGSVTGRTSLIDPIKVQAMMDVGGVVSPFNAWLISRGSVTLPLRIRRISETAQTVAEWLERDPRVAWVRYPGLASHPQHRLATALLGGGGAGLSGMMAFAPRLPPAEFLRVVRGLRLITNTTSLGHDETLIVQIDHTGDRQRLYGEPFVSTGAFRLSIGLEDAEDLIADLDAALDAVAP